MSYTQNNKWTVTRLDTGGLLIDLTSNPTLSTSGIVIQSNTLYYGIYEFKFKVDILVLSTRKNFSVESTTYIQIIPSGLAVYALANGIQIITIGNEQSLILNPLAFSFDFDNLAFMDNLTYKFYCSPVYLNTWSNTIDLAEYTKNSSLIMNSSQTCFSSPNNGYYFDSTENVLTIMSGSLLSEPSVNKFHFRIETFYMNLTFSQIIQVQIDLTYYSLPFVNLK